MKKKIIFLAVIIMIIGIVVVIAAGFNVDLKYKNHKEIIIPIGTEYNINDIKTITNEVFGKNNVVIEKSGLYKDEVVIRSNDISDEQKNLLKNKFNEKYNITQEIIVQIGDNYAVEDVQAIAKEVFGKESIKVEKEKDNEKYVSIEANLITEQDRDNLNNKINEKYGLSNEADSISVSNIIYVSNIPRVRLIDMAKQYLVYTAIATILVFIYFIIRFKKLGIKKVLIELIVSLVVAELLYAAIIAITRFPINKLIIATAIAIYMVVLAYLNAKYINCSAKAKK